MGATSERSARAFYAGLLEALIQVMGTANSYLFTHPSRMALMALDIARVYGLESEERAQVFFAGILSDLGMIGLVEDEFENPTPVLSAPTRAQVQEHPLRSEEAVLSIPYLEDLAPLVRHHHEWWNGRGYPDGCFDDEIPMGARILRLADTVTAMGEKRPHRGPLSQQEIEEVVRASSGSEFAPDIADAYLTTTHDRDGLFQTSNFRQALLLSAGKILPGQVSAVSAERLLDVFGCLIDAKDPYTGGHSSRVAHFSKVVANGLGLDQEFSESVESAGYLHDLGKVAVPLRILTKDGRLTSTERGVVERHTTSGARILTEVPALRTLAAGCRYHHERWDGEGYPEGLSRAHIPLVAQILAVTDSYDAMTSGRAYRVARSHSDAMEEIEKGAGTQFSPRVVDAFTSMPSATFEKIKGAPVRAQTPFTPARVPRPQDKSTSPV